MNRRTFFRRTAGAPAGGNRSKARNEFLSSAAKHRVVLSGGGVPGAWSVRG